MKTLLAISLWLLACGTAQAAVTPDATGSGEGTTSASYAHSIASDATLILVCLAERDTNASGFTANSASVTVDGQAATQLIAVQDGTPQSRMVMFYKVAPSTGSVTISSTADTGTERLVTASLSLKGAATSSTFNTATSNSSLGSTDADVNTIASASGEFGVLCGASLTAASSASADATTPVSTEQLDIAHTDATSVRNWIYTEDGAASSIDMRVDLASSVRWSAVAVSIRAAASPSSTRHRGVVLLP